MLKLYCSKAKTLVELNKEELSLYCCGPTVYGPAHIGNFRAFVMQDILRRAIELNGKKVVHVRNITDIDDKIINKASSENCSIEEVASFWRQKFETDCAKLNLLGPHHSPGAVEYIPAQVQMIETLLSKGHAYYIDADVYFDTATYARYGELSGCCKSEGTGDVSRVESSHKRDKRDFVLWKGDADYWDSPFGKGRPGWHIECSAMATSILGNTIDIHSGGEDLLFPHHENEVAQSEACTGETFVRHWHHVSHLMVDGSKMSKSLGNLYTLDDLVARRFSANDLRYLYFGTHYRKPLNFSFAGLQAAQRSVKRILRYIGTDALESQNAGKTYNGSKYLEELRSGLNADLNTSLALSVINKAIAEGASQAEVAEIFFSCGFSGSEGLKERQVQHEIPEIVMELAEKRRLAKENKDYAYADYLREKIESEGFRIVDTGKSFKIEKLD